MPGPWLCEVLPRMQQSMEEVRERRAEVEELREVLHTCTSVFSNFTFAK